ncbi:SGNH hydrolase [Mollisia scopiformis]|uniref:SGNH hydrolase n=1 Tax=Mollisia scopiformis TaxID=149040 RepID=A0A194WU72_MOLSC|nr:SGNH hydrolase [Mollisia scopiformis]KUJ11157.1 SGNH hydrolase [Mollisia scopiformis]
MFLNNSLHILCFGDSLTAGWSLSTHPVLHPYAGSLEATLGKSLPSINVSTDVQGVGGDQTECPPNVCPGFLPRMEKLYQELDDSQHYDWAVILGGTNDLNAGRDAPEIYTSLQKVWGIPLSHDTKVLALTVPECGYCEPITNKRKAVLNDNILKHPADNFFTFNLHDSVPYGNMSEEMRKEIWDDIIHFTPKGYDLVGSRIAERLTEILKDDLSQDRDHGELKK